MEEETILVCDLPEDENHTHGEECYETIQKEAETPAEPHVHTDECYEWNKVLICEKSTEPDPDAQPILICEEPEIIPHAHGKECYDKDGNRICGKQEILIHQHGNECFQQVEEALDTTALTCPLSENENHTHGPLCYGVWELTCGMEEHTHSEECTQNTESEASSGLPVMGTAYAAPGRMRASAQMRLSEVSTYAAEGPLDVTNYLSGVKFYYKAGDMTDWVEVTGNEAEIPGNAKFKLDISYSNVIIDDLLAANAKMIYQLPSLLRNATTQGSITSGNETVGTVTVENGVVTLAFNQEWVAQQKTDNNNVIGGDFNVQAQANLSQIEDGIPGEIIVGNTNIKINFDDDVIAKYGDVEIVKAVSGLSQEADGDYLTYTLTVTAGQDGCPDVTVRDSFVDARYIEEYVIGEDTGSVSIDASTEPDTLVWKIGDMEANTTRTLTYRVKLKDAYTGGAAKDALQNTANLYSKEYPRDSDTADFRPNADVDVIKTVSQVSEYDEHGGRTITYTVEVRAGQGNSYVLENVKIVDALDGSVNSRNSTAGKFRKYINYIDNSFCLTNGDETEEPLDSSRLTLPDTDGDGRKNDSFTCDIGSLGPGERKKVTYQVYVEAGVELTADSAIAINNSAGVFAGGEEQSDSFPDHADVTHTFSGRTWSEKSVGERVTGQEDWQIPITSDAYDATGDSVTKIDNPEERFTVPIGSCSYSVYLTQTPDWDLSSASMSDSFNDPHLQFVGYVMVIASDTEGHSQTVWVKVDGMDSFHFTPSQIGLDGWDHYVLIYYAQPVNVDEISQVKVTNTFTLSGDVGIGDKTYTIIDGIETSADVTVEGSNSFTASKTSWYYEPPKDGPTTGAWGRGALYWVIKVDGNVLPEGTHIRDWCAQKTGNRHYIREDSLVGVYTGQLGDMKQYASVEELPGDSLTALKAGEDFTAEIRSVENQPRQLDILLEKNIRLPEGDSLYIILKSDPTTLPADKEAMIYYHNTVSSSYDGTNYIDYNTAAKILYGSDNIIKKMGRVFTYSDSDGIKTLHMGAGKETAIDTVGLSPGAYVAWQIRINHGGNLAGRYRLVEQIPAGMEAAYVRLSWCGNSLTGKNAPSRVRLTDGELGEGWEECSHVSGGNTDYYYVNGQQVIWDIDNLQARGGGKDAYAVEFQVVCRVTDPDVLLGGEEKAFHNSVSLLNADGDNVGSDSDSTTVQTQTLSKKSTYEKSDGGRYPFQLTLNEQGEDLIPDAETIVLLDTLSDTLTLDSGSIRVINTATGEEVTKWTASVTGQTLKMVLPDNLPLTITYEASVNAAPNEPVTIYNDAHWEGYSTPSSGQVKEESFSYSTGGTAGGSSDPTVTIQKRNQYNTSELLSGAKFSLTEGTYENDTFTPTADGLSLTGTTNESGTLTFGREAGKVMKYNTIYRLVETEAPKGYALDSTPHYFAIAQKIKSGDDGEEVFPTFPEGVTVWYLGADYTYQAYNHKGEAAVEKKFQDAGGNELEKIDGTYRFGIYADETPTGTPLQKVSVTYANGTGSGMANFIDLTLGEAYYIYELDDSGNPIQDGALATVNGMRFAVSYPEGHKVTVSADGTAAASVVVTNRVSYRELPETGGIGTNVYTVGGLLFIMAAWLLGYCDFKRRNRNF